MRSYLYLNTNTSTSVSSNPDEAGYQWSNADIQMLLDEVYTRELSILLPQVGIRTDEFHILLQHDRIYISPNNFVYFIKFLAIQYNIYTYLYTPFLIYLLHIFTIERRSTILSYE